MNNAERAVLDLARAQHGAIARRQALELGMSERAIHYRLNQGEWVRVFRGAYRLRGTNHTWDQTVMAACLAAGPDAVASHRAAATLFGMPGVTRWVEVTVPRPRQVCVEGLIAHRTRLLTPSDVGEIRGIPVTTAARTFVDLAGIYRKAKLSAALDYCLARRLLTRPELVCRLAALGGEARRGSGLIQVLLDERPDTARAMGSEFEADLFGGLRPAGIPLPVAQYRVLMEDGSSLYLDFAYPEVKLAIEADSYLWHASLADWQRDRARNGELVARGWAILPVTWDQVRYHPGAVADLVRRALGARAA